MRQFRDIDGSNNPDGPQDPLYYSEEEVKAFKLALFSCAQVFQTIIMHPTDSARIGSRMRAAIKLLERAGVPISMNENTQDSKEEIDDPEF